MLEFLTKQKYPAIVLLLGFLLVIVSSFKIDDIKNFQIEPTNPNYSILVLGVLLITTSILIFLSTEDSIAWLRPIKIKKTSSGYTAELGSSTLNVMYGKLEDCSTDDTYSAVILPANEFFDDECIIDKRSALGAYIQSKFPAQIQEIKQQIKIALEGKVSRKVEKEPSIFQDSYMVGTCIYLDRPLSSTHRMIMAAVTTKRAGEALRAEISYVFRVINQACKIMVDKRLNKLYFPLLGSGHGGLRREVAFFTLVLALSEILCRPSGAHVEVNIVVFKAAQDGKPELAPKVLKRVLRTATGMFH